MITVQSPERGISESQGDRPRPARLSLSRLSIKQRLPLLIGAVLLGVIVASTWASYRGVKESALEVGHERLERLTQQLATMFQESAAIMANKTSTAANDPAIQAYLRSPATSSRSGAEAVLHQFMSAQDPSCIRVELWNSNRSRALALPEGSSEVPADLEAEFDQSDSGPSFSAVGAFRVLTDSIAHPVVAAVRSDGEPGGYLVRWRRISATPDARQKFLDLIGTGADLYLGNSQGDIWTDRVNVSPKPPVDVRVVDGVTHYTREGKSSVAALARPIGGTPWSILVEFSDQAMLAQADRFLRRMVVIGLVLLAIGMASAWALSRSITQPLHSLTVAASAIAAGDYSSLVDVRANNEVAALAGVFNTMVVRVRDSERDLELKVQQRTAQLEDANKELEAFSYSVSHDLRAPLRAVDGFSQAVVEDYGPQLPEEARRYLETIRESAQRMGALIDDLLTFSRLSRTPLETRSVDTGKLVRNVLEDMNGQLDRRRVDVRIEDLPVCQGDPALLKHVWVNLLSNALKFTSKREAAVVEIGSARAQGENVFFVRDNGTGFDMKYAGKLFGVFQRLHREDEFEGTGVGLAIVQRIINRHGGRVWADAALDRGATLYFTLGGETEHE